MGLKPLEVKALTLVEFSLMLRGYHKAKEEAWNHTRHIMAFQLNYGGFGAKKFVRPEQIWPLHMDKEGIKRFITSVHQAMELLRGFE